MTDRITPAPFGLRETGSPRGAAEWAGVLLHGRERTKKEMLELADELQFEGARQEAFHVRLYFRR